jgi:hypothetical protein
MRMLFFFILVILGNVSDAIKALSTKYNIKILKVAIKVWEARTTFAHISIIPKQIKNLIKIFKTNLLAKQ